MGQRKNEGLFVSFADQTRNAKQLLQDSLHNVQDIKGNRKILHLSVFKVINSRIDVAC